MNLTLIMNVIFLKLWLTITLISVTIETPQLQMRNYYVLHLRTLQFCIPIVKLIS